MKITVYFKGQLSEKYQEIFARLTNMFTGSQRAKQNIFESDKGGTNIDGYYDYYIFGDFENNSVTIFYRSNINQRSTFLNVLTMLLKMINEFSFDFEIKSLEIKEKHGNATSEYRLNNDRKMLKEITSIIDDNALNIPKLLTFV